MILGKEKNKSEVQELTEKNFDNFKDTHKIAVIDCYNNHCAPCRKIHPMIDELANKYLGRIGFGRLNTDIAVGVAVKYGVMSVPTILIFKNGSLVGSMKKVKSLKHLEEEILKYAR